MKKFKFKLQKLLDIKLAAEDVIKHELAKAVGEQNVLRVKQQKYIAEIEKEKKTFHEKMKTGKYQFNELRVYSHFNEFADKVIKDSEQEIESMEPAINEIRSRLTEATKARRVIEKLKEKRYSEWKYEVRKHEDKEIDDMNQRVFARRKTKISRGVYYDE